tara:strand:- start:1497 stop:2576 length:1080 start_codon:yes stop_codon:yes gene_type:complete
MYDVLFLDDAQDLWLFNYFIENSTKNNSKYRLVIFYTDNNKITSANNSLLLENLKNAGLELFFFKGKEDKNFQQALNQCRFFITKDYLPFYESHEFLEKTLVISWVGESANSKSNKRNRKVAFPGARVFVEEIIQPAFSKIGISKFGNSPKYYFLNRYSRTDLCKMLGLNPAKKYVTIFSNVFFDYDPFNYQLKNNISLNGKSYEIYSQIESFCQSHGYEIILKNKLKYGTAFQDSIKHGIFFDGNPGMFHQGLCLMRISEFSVGFGTSAAVEAQEIGHRFISFWNDDYSEINDSLYDNIISGGGKSYRLAQSSSIFTIKKDEILEEIKLDLNNFMKNSKCIDSISIGIDPFLAENFGG